MALPARLRLVRVVSRALPPEHLLSAVGQPQRAVWLLVLEPKPTGLLPRARAQGGQAGCVLLWRPLPWPAIQFSRRTVRRIRLQTRL